MDGGDSEAARRYIGDLRSAVGQAHGDLRNVLSHLREPMESPGLRHLLDAGGLVLADLRHVDHLALVRRRGEVDAADVIRFQTIEYVAGVVYECS